MVASARLALEHLADIPLEQFVSDVKTQDAVLWRLAMIGEAANHVTKETRAAIELPWLDVIAQRHVAIHHYRKLQMPRIWSTVRDDLPVLIATLERHLP